MISYQANEEGTSFLETISRYLEPEPLIVPPMLSKSALVEQPILRMIWQEAQEKLASADHITFVGYSLPMTDFAASVLFEETLYIPPEKKVKVVDISGDNEEKIQMAYKEIAFDIQFDFRGALAWSRDLVEGRLKA
jgi:hypothetical protein